jgi:transposase-like protein
MNTEIKHPKTLVDAIRYFSDLDRAHDFFIKIRWPDGVVRCPHCGAEGASFLAKYRRWECKNKHDRRQFTVKVGSVLEDSPMTLDKWAVAFWLEINCKNSISSYEVARALGITQKSAWFMLHRVRHVMHDGSLDKIGGPGCEVEADETYIGGKAINMHRSYREEKIRGTGGANKTAVMGLLERHSEKGKSKVKTVVLEGNVNRDSIHPVIHKNIEQGTQLYTDAHGAYTGLGADYLHAFIDHAEKYVEGRVHTNGLENFWSLFKRCIKGTHVSVEPFHLQAYLDSECFRFDQRELNDGERFLLAIRGYADKRLTYKALTSNSPGLRPASGNSNAEGAGLPN